MITSCGNEENALTYDFVKTLIAMVTKFAINMER